eukprot:TRINITY_DN112531_c0_g1_i1.p1 TRINITY_DN112531_c0_g1~~TRINITY_DN112531_c0_g1_i1.p1  ORF type:complete len:391 (-),score=62.25 TRINITY_DN112531_c0_g1_i1:43-1107(-)
MDDNSKQDDELLSWSTRQGHILTGGGLLEQCFRDFAQEDLPHHHLQRCDTWSAFASFKPSPLICGAWRRPLFMGGWMESTEEDTECWNIQTTTLFVDVRFPKGLARQRLCSLARTAGKLEGLDDRALRLLARQHAFGGYSVVKFQETLEAPVATRHHCIDWNFHPSFPRPRPNQWRVQMSEDNQSFKEFGVAKDSHGQAVYMERWQRLAGGSGATLALRRSEAGREGILVVVGDHFAFIADRRKAALAPWPLPEAVATAGGGCAKLVDAALAAGQRDLAEQLLSIEGSCGSVSSGWIIHRSTLPWREGVRLRVGGSSRRQHLRVEGEDWAIFECTMTAEKLSEVIALAAEQSKL